MDWTKRYYHKAEYEFTGCNQHGDRFKRAGTKIIPTVEMRTEMNDCSALTRLILLSHHLDTPVRYDFETTPHSAYIVVTSVAKLTNA